MDTRPLERRREPRTATNLPVSVMGEDDDFFDLETCAVDVSAHGAAVLMDRFVLLNTMVELRAQGGGFTAWAVVRSNRSDQRTGRPVIGLEYLSGVRYPGRAGGPHDA